MRPEMKKEYKAPQLVIHGDIEKITQRGPMIHHTDVPFGEETGQGVTLNDITS